MAALLPSTEHPTQTPDNSSQTGNSVVETQNTLRHPVIIYKLILHHHTQKLHISNPIYEVCKEGPEHAPRYRATVLVCEKRYTSHTTFSHRKAAEQDAARIAWEDIAPKTDDEEKRYTSHTTFSHRKAAEQDAWEDIAPKTDDEKKRYTSHATFSHRKAAEQDAWEDIPPKTDNEEKLPDIEEYTLFCKTILYAFAEKMHFDKPTYNTLQPDALVLSFKSVVTFNGKSYTGELAKNKKEAERFAARAAILSLLESKLKHDLSKMIKSKVNPAASTVSEARRKSFVPPSVQQYILYVHRCGRKRKWNDK